MLGEVQRRHKAAGLRDGFGDRGRDRSPVVDARALVGERPDRSRKFRLPKDVSRSVDLAVNGLPRGRAGELLARLRDGLGSELRDREAIARVTQGVGGEQTEAPSAEAIEQRE